MEFRKYQHIERLGSLEVEDILLGTCYVFPKIDGTNASIWVDKGGYQAGSRTRQLTLEKDNANFYKSVLTESQFDGVKKFLDDNPNYKFFGEWLCLSGDTKIRLVSGGKKPHVRTLKEMYSYQEDNVTEEAHYIKKDGTKTKTLRKSWWKRHGMPQCFSLFQNEDIIKPQKIKKIIKSGIKEVYEIKTRKGYSLKSTIEHKFYTNTGWRQLKDININDVVAITELFNYRRKRNYGKGANKIKKIFSDLRKNQNCKICGINNSLEIHHKDEDWKNNSINNLQVLCKECHCKIHKNITAINQSFDYDFDKVISIKFIGKEECYDISMEAEENSASFIANGFIVHNCPHSLKTYRDEAWRKFYVFDVIEEKEDNTFRYLSYEEYQKVCEEYDINYIPCLKIIKNPTEERLYATLAENDYLIKDGEGQGEGLVIKNYNFTNKFGRTTWAKIVTSEFKEKHRKTMGASEVTEQELPEDKFIEKYCTEALIDKTYSKIVNENEGWTSKFIPRLLETVFRDLVVECTYDAIKKLKLKKIDFSRLKKLTQQRIKQVKTDLF